MDADHTAANQFIQAARRAMQGGNRSAARRLAQQALKSASDIAEPWLILAEVASPHGRLYYLCQAERLFSAGKISRPVKKGFPWAYAALLSALLVPLMLAWLTWGKAFYPLARMISLAPSHPSGETRLPVFSPTAETTQQVSAVSSVPVRPTQTATSTPTSFPTPVKTQTRIPNPSPTSTETQTPNPRPTATQDPHAPNIYTVKRGETLEKIASKFGSDLDELMRVNNIDDASTVRRGMRLIIPMDSPGGAGQKVNNSKPSSPRKSGKSILVDISKQHLYAYEGKKLVLDFDVSTGRNGSTATGTFSVLDKIQDAWSAPWGFWMPDWMGIYYVGSNLENGFHSLPVLTNGEEIWGDKIGVPISYGCIVLDPAAMGQLYDWAEIGTLVLIQP